MLARSHCSILMNLTIGFHARPAHVIGIKLSRCALDARVGDVRPYIGSVRGTAAGIGRLTADFVESFAKQAEGIGESAAPVLVRQFLDLAQLLLTAKEYDRSLPAMTPAEAGAPASKTVR